DGPTDACGAIVDAATALAARERGRDPGMDLRWHRSYHALDAAGVLLKTGPTGTNVMDVVAVYIARAAANE
ncbi:MAG: MOFRL family protein, partial [Gemmatimonadaceae bacterium]